MADADTLETLSSKELHDLAVRYAKRHLDVQLLRGELLERVVDLRHRAGAYGPRLPGREGNFIGTLY